MKRLIAILCTLLFTAGCFDSGKTDTSVTGTDPALKKDSRRETPVVDAVRMIKNSVVNIRTEKIIPKDIKKGTKKELSDNSYYNDFYGHSKAYKTQSLGSGFIVKSDGTIITNYHVIAAASKIYVLLNDNTTYEAKLIGGDNIIDIAVLKIINTNNRKFPIASLGNSDGIMLGETVIAMGDPYGLSSSVTTGVISSVKRIIKIGLGYSQFIQTDALINPGNSGGPLVNLDGEVIGINSAVVEQAQGIGFTIPINTAIRVLPEILKNHRIHTGYIGITAQEMETKDGLELTIVNVEKGTNAYKIGLKPGDRILMVNDTPIASLIAMSNMLRSYPAGSSISIVVLRGNKTLRGKILLTDYPAGYGVDILQSDYGLTFAPTSGGLTVLTSKYDNILKKGDILTAVNNRSVTSLDVLNKIIMANLGREILLNVNKGGKEIKIRIQI